MPGRVTKVHKLSMGGGGRSLLFAFKYVQLVSHYSKSSCIKNHSKSPFLSKNQEEERLVLIIIIAGERRKHAQVRSKACVLTFHLCSRESLHSTDVRSVSKPVEDQSLLCYPSAAGQSNAQKATAQGQRRVGAKAKNTTQELWTTH